MRLARFSDLEQQARTYLRGGKVVDESGQILGAVADVLLDLETQRPAAVVLDSGDKFAIDDLALDPMRQILVLQTGAGAPAAAGMDIYYLEIEEAVSYGRNLAQQHAARRSFVQIEADARRDWESRKPGTWEKVRSAVSQGWHSLTGGNTMKSTTDSNDIIIGRLAPDDTNVGEKEFIEEYVRRYGSMDSYADHEGAFRFGSAHARSDEYRGRSWNEVNEELRARWEAEHQQPWDEVDEAVHMAWSTARHERFY